MKLALLLLLLDNANKIIGNSNAVKDFAFITGINILVKDLMHVQLSVISTIRFVLIALPVKIKNV